MSVEDQIVVGPHLMHRDDRRRKRSRPSAQQTEPGSALAEHERRRVEADQHVAPGLNRLSSRLKRIAAFGERVLGPPQVLADQHADALPGHLHDTSGLAGLEIAIFIKDVVPGKQAFIVDGQHLTVGTHRRAVAKRPLAVRAVPGMANDHSEITRMFGDLLYSLLARLDDTVPKQQVARGIADQPQLAGHEHIRAVAPGRIDRIEHQTGVAGDVAHGRIELSQGQSHGRGLYGNTRPGNAQPSASPHHGEIVSRSNL